MTPVSEKRAGHDNVGGPVEASGALIDALREFLRVEADRPPPQPSARERPAIRQAGILLLFAIDLALLYQLLPADWLEHRLVKFVAKLAPVLFGGLLFTYFDSLRAWLLKTSTDWRFASAVVICFAVLLTPQLPVFSIQVQPVPENVVVYRTGTNDKINLLRRDAEKTFLLLPGFRRYEITVLDSVTDPKSPYDFTFTLGHWALLRGTVARIPLLGGWLGSGVFRLTPLYPVGIHVADSTTTSQAGGGGFPGGSLEVEGEFPDAFASNTTSRRQAAGHTSSMVWRHDIAKGVDHEYIALPPGRYDFTLILQSCRKHLPMKQVTPGDSNDLWFAEIHCSS
jgi:hypothetical protein